ncbi:MAG: transcription elongation factor GreAB [Gammaproteobacteria bacterium RIFCSPHIGHO2_12_FULL_45_12]|nr:MAG: transcription elongation factor GreAB [Gammaproteobacteria bacterium RIFCSPHIGHO2_12_FULL_45_12]
MTLKINHGEIWLTNLNPSHGTEAGKSRPVLIFQNQALLDINHPSTLIIPLTTQLAEDAAPLRIRVNAAGKLKKDSDLLIDQIRAIDNKRLISGPLLCCDNLFMEKVYHAVNEVIGMTDLDY